MVTSHTLQAASRLAAAARKKHPLGRVNVRADDLMELVNAFWAETKRADIASNQLERAVNDLLAIAGPRHPASCLN